MADGSDKKKDREEDPRLEFVRGYVLKTMRLKVERWQKMMNTDEHRYNVMIWLNNPEIKRLIITNNAGILGASHSFPATTKQKLSYFVRKRPEELTVENIRQLLLVGDMSPRPIQDLSILLDHVFYPLLTNPLNQKGWPEVVKRDVETHIQDLRNTIAEVKGNMIGQTLLPMPITIDKVMQVQSQIALGKLDACDAKMKNSLEGIVIKWACQIDAVLKEDSSTLFTATSHPMPFEECQFWQHRLQNLENIFLQLRDPRVKQVGAVLQSIESVYFASFSATFKSVVEALHEARDITLFLKPLEKHFDNFEAVDFVDIQPMIDPLLHCVCLLWSNSPYYGKNSRMVILFKMIHNMLINAASKALDPDGLFQGEAEEALIKVDKVIENMNYYRDSYHDYKNRLPGFVKPETTPIFWTFRPKDVFERFDLFMQRLSEVRDILSTAFDFKKLEKVEIGCHRGKLITRKIKEINDEFTSKAMKNWKDISFNPLDPDPKLKHFAKEKARFQEQSDVLERRLAVQFKLAFDDCSNLDQQMKLVHILGTLLSRPLIAPHVMEQLKALLHLYEDDLDVVKDTFDGGLEKFTQLGFKGFPIDAGYPDVAGTLMWIKKLKQRINRPLQEAEMLDYPIFDNEQGEYILSKHKEMLSLLEEFDSTIFDKWASEVPVDIETYTKEFILQRSDENQLIQMNFNPKLVEALKETRYLKNMDVKDIPEQALEFFDRYSELWDTRMSLLRVVEWYNVIRTDTVGCEFEILRTEVEGVDELLSEALEKFDWNSYEQTYVKNLYDTVKSLYTRVSRAQENIRRIQQDIKSYGKVPLYERREEKIDTLIALDDRVARLKKRKENCENTQVLINDVINENFRLLFGIAPKTESMEDVLDEQDASQEEAKPAESTQEEIQKRPSMVSKASQVSATLTEIKLPEEEKSDQNFRLIASPEQMELYRPYEEYVDRIVGDELMEAIKTSISYLKVEIENTKKHNAPVFEVILELQVNKMTFVPALDSSLYRFSMMSLIEDLIMDIYNMSDEIYRVAQPLSDATEEQQSISGLETYESQLRENQDIDAMKNDIISLTRSTCREAIEYFKIYEKYNYIWLDDRKTFLEHFLRFGRYLTPDEITNLDSPEFPLKEVSEISLEKFRDQIDFYNELYEEVHKVETSHNFRVWLVVNMKPFKAGLLNEICKWSNMFKQHLATEVRTKLQNLEDFIVESNKILALEPTEDDFPMLLKILAVINQIKTQEVETDTMFGPLREYVDLLAEYNLEFEEKVYNQFAELPELWERLKKTAVQVKTNIAPIQAYQVDLISKRISLFDFRMNILRERFKKLPFFSVPCDNAYELCDKMKIELDEKRNQFEKLTESAELFELNKPDEVKLNQCEKEIRLVKQIWDFVYVIESCVNDWKKTAWKRINVEDMEQECKKFGKEMRALDKDMRGWIPYLHLEALLKNLLISLKAITELQNPAIRDRHWIELMHATKVRFNMDDSTTLSDLLDLNLHKYEEEVRYIVEKSVKEMAMEKTIRDLSTTWKAIDLEFEEHPRTKLKLLKVNEEVIEMLQENTNQVNALLSSKYIAYFLDEMSNWQNQLSNADQVQQLFFEVQRMWMYLESIFVGSEDIRKQLPEKSRDFDNIDREFRSILAQMTAEKNFVRATNIDGLARRLEEIERLLKECEKALENYLEEKKLIYPRFYFVSNADLLDILSNGNQPELVARHLTKLYDSLAKLVFSSKGSKTAIKMVSKENEEHVEFIHPCDCSGQVEVWLNRITDIMRVTLRDLFEKAIKAYVENSRDVWIFEWAAQPALCTTQIWWTIEVNLAFFKMEEGYEKAMKDYLDKHIRQLKDLIMLLLGDLNQGDRQKIMTVCTIDVHARDVVAKMIEQKVESVNAFQWQSQLRHRWDDKMSNCFVNICDAQFTYDYEYLGNTPRLVITPLTDRCYITLTQSLHLIMGGAPAGPAGTGKTETTKDLGRALGIMVYVFNCSEQMTSQSCEQIYKGLAQTGAWGCFDEFNRISVEVLSVIATQVKTIQDAIKARKSKFVLGTRDITLIPTVGIFITMNPGYAGRAELPENLKALFRPCAMVVPDFELICEIMLVAEGFQEARMLARKFITLYTLCKELLSKQDHYDWGLRAIKSVLVVAGHLKRSDRPDTPEEHVLMRALRDFNLPKIVTDDEPVFRGLIGDLFPNIDAKRKPDFEFEKTVAKSARELKLQQDKMFVLKVVQLQELFEVRHSVFILGNAGTGKTEVWKTLYKSYQNMKLKPHYDDLNPKAVTNDELFGIVNPATKEWKDGLFSVIMRNQTNLGGTGPKWIVLDGDIDPMWIESLNTVMDDNKVLTLASNERIAMTKEMRLLFEISHLKTATPATVSRAGILYINPQDLGWNPYVASWIETREIQAERGILTVLFDKYIPTILEHNHRFKKITPISEIAHLQMTCFLLESLLTPQNVPHDCPKEWYEVYFVFCVIWGFGSTLFQDQLVDWRNEFHKWWTNEFKVVKFPAGGTVFNYYIDPETKKFLPWSNLVQGFELDVDLPLQSTLVPTDETTRLRWFMDVLIEAKHPFMLVGGAGSGKSVSVSEKLTQLAFTDKYAITNVPFNFYITSEMLQKILEKPLEKKAGRNFGPPKNKFMLYFIDDINMPEVDKYYTVQPHTLIRQFMDYRHWYDRAKLTLKEIHNCQFVACMNPTAGSFTITPRLQRHFCAFAVSFPTGEPLFHIYNSILSQHLANPHAPLKPFTNSVQKLCGTLVTAALTLHARVAQIFLPTATKFHYIFNLRDLSNIFQGILFTGGDAVTDQNQLIRLWVHEATRVYCDKLVDAHDIDNFQKLVVEIVKKGFEEFDDQKVFDKPLIYWHYADGLADAKYMPVRDMETLTKLMIEAQDIYNNSVGDMNLVLFEDAIGHICRITRILEAPRGNALLIGVGGSGKQSLSRLAALISNLEVTQIVLGKDYGINDLKQDIAVLYMKAGVKNVPYMFLMTDAQVAEEHFLVLINDMLASGEISELFPDDEVENIVNALRNEVKQYGIMDTNENCWKFFIDRVRKNLKIVLSFSPVGSTLRVRARKFPAIVNCTAIDWFHEWPKNALESVSESFLEDLEVLPEILTKPVALFMAYVHGTVNEMSKIYLQNERRYNYTTPKSFLELIALYSKLLSEKAFEVKERIGRLESGIKKLTECSHQVADLQEVLAEQEVVLREKNDAADKLIIKVNAEREKVQAEKDVVSEEEKVVRVIEEEVTARAKACEEDLKKAEPALRRAEEALNTLDKADITELKGFSQPHESVLLITEAVLILTEKKEIVPRDRSWKACKVMLSKDGFLKFLQVEFDKNNIHPNKVKEVRNYLKNPNFNPETARTKAKAAGGLCEWVINIINYHDVYVDVAPKIKAKDEAQEELTAARAKVDLLNAKVKELEDKLAIIEAEQFAAQEEKDRCQAEADKTAFTIDLANRLVNGLSSEGVRWRDSVAILQKQETTLPGDVLLVSCFLSYVGCFTRRYRQELQEKMWIPTFRKTKPQIPYNDSIDPLSLITDEALIASWNNEGLPTDRMSAENATILLNSSRWPLMIDPQLQGIKWIKQRYGDKLVVPDLKRKDFHGMIEKAISNGDVLLLENIGETMEALFDPLLGRQLIKKGTCLKMGDKEIDYNPNFRLILQTKLANPHYKPEMQAQTTLINFTVTRDGLEEQLLGEVVKVERPELEEQRSMLTKQQNEFKIKLKFLEDDLLARLSAADENILQNVELVESLEETKATAADIARQAGEAQNTAIAIDKAREKYRKVAERASILYFILNDLFKINPMYQFSLKAYTVVFKRAIFNTLAGETEAERVANLIDSISFAVFVYTSRALFERDKLTFMAQMAIQILLQAKEIQPTELDFLLRFPYAPNQVSPVEFLTNVGWGGIKALALMDEFKSLDKDIQGSAKRWRKFVESECPEREKFPGEWKNKSALQRLCIMRCLRPDRMTYAVRTFIEEKLGTKYVEARNPDFKKTFEETGPTTPTFFILSPGVNPIKDVETMWNKLGMDKKGRTFYDISLGQGQEEKAEKAIELSAENGDWAILQNVHLVARWLSNLETKMVQSWDSPHEDYRLFISAEPAGDPEYHIIPQGVLESAIKVTNEPPSGMMANVHQALDNFSQETLEMCSKETEFKGILFALCYFHAVVSERRKFGAQGWNRVYPFNVGDLTISVSVLYNYLEANNRVPWDDLRYLFGEIMYGGHITDDWDRRLCRTYLEEFMQADLVDGDLYFCPGFLAPPNMDYVGYHSYINENLPPESPTLFYMHSNAEIGFLTSVSEQLFKTIFELQPRDATGTTGVSVSREDLVKGLIEDFMDKLPEEFNIPEMNTRVEEKTPFVIVAIQECDRMNILMREVRRSLRELSLGLKGELTITPDMEEMESNLFFDRVPESWTKRAYPSMVGLQSWFADVQLRLRELENWTADFTLPASVWLAGLFNPQSFLTAIMQETARKRGLALDSMRLSCDVTRKWKEDFTQPPREGAYVNGLYMEGARWDMDMGTIATARLKELFPQMPVIYIKAITQDKAETKNIYQCPVYRTRMRGPTFVWTFDLKTKEKAAKWTLGGVCLLLQV